MKADTRIIESEGSRIVHFIFNPTRQSTKVTPFTRKFKLLLEEDLESFEREEHEKFEKYIDMWIDESLDENDKFPIVYEDNTFSELELNAIDHISLAVADNPFYKIDNDKYYPEAVVVNSDGEILARLSANQKEADCPQFPSLKYKQGFRDEMMRVNDDRKIEMRLSEFKEPGIQVIFFVRSFDLSKEKDILDGTYDQAWFRIQNETTSQTIDYMKVNKMEVPDSYVEFQEGEDSPARNELVYVVGRVFCDDKLRKKSKNSSTCWVYEQYNKIVESQKFPDVAQTMADLIRSANEEVEEYDSLIKQAQDKLQQVAEERKAAQAAAQAKKKAAGKKNKKEEPKEEAQAEEVKSRATPLLVQSSTNQEVSDDEEYDLFLADQFQKALTHKFVRPFTIGPITFKELQMTFDYEVQRKVVVSELEKTPSMKENNIFVHGLKVTVKDRNLKRGTSLLKHARFLQNLQITPILPPPISPPAEHLSQHSEEMANE